MPDFWPFFKKRAREEPPAKWSAHLATCTSGWEMDTPLRDIPAVVLDTETTGLRMQRDRIRSIGAIRLVYPELRTDTTFCVQFRGETKIDEGVAIHELLPRQGESEAGESLEALLDFIGPRIIIGHHIAFDLKMVERALSRHFKYQVTLPNPRVDTAHIAQRLFPRHPMQRPWSLNELSVKLKVPGYQRHTAGGDAFITGLVYLKLLGRLSPTNPLVLGDVLGPARRHWGL